MQKKCKSTQPSFLLRIISFLVVSLTITSCTSVQKYFFNPTPEFIPGSVLFQDDFSTKENNWKTWNQENAFVDYQADGLYFLINEPYYDYWSKPGFKFSDVMIQTDAIKVGGPNNNSYGVICRMVDEENFYAFIISSDGYAGILKVIEGKYELLNNNSMEFFAEIVAGDAVNQLTAVCDNNQLSLAINGKIALQVEDTSFSTGDVGFLVGTFAEPGVEILFDNLVVLQP